MPSFDAARDLLARLQHESRTMVLECGEVDPGALATLLQAGMDDPETVRFLAAFLSRCIAGSVPDFRTWHPFELWTREPTPLQQPQQPQK